MEGVPQLTNYSAEEHGLFKPPADLNAGKTLRAMDIHAKQKATEVTTNP
eukprot:CAMPEP_0117589096 /NCGR_PEP_ID=MMETSP0784-20121206/70221_1 /TAXON_ID=39447 /ORGANISM="" /LENGTH=48 /DNA_ID= /DNA_START= /DNA_END= /DNA_ORIENTATION=